MFLIICIVSLGTYFYVEQLEYHAEEEALNLFHVVDYKYYRDDISYIVESSGKTYELYTEEKLSIGDRCMGHFEINFPEEERNFIKKDDQLRLIMNSVHGRIYEEAIDECQKVDYSLVTFINHLRHQYIMKILESTRYDFKYDIVTLSIGNKSYIESRFFDSLQKLGIYHLYVISGTHIAFISGMLFYIFRKMRWTLQFIKWMLIAALVLFSVFNFFSPSVFRAVFMAVMLIITSMFKKKPYLSVISISAIIQIWMNPYIVFHAGFQLSYITTYFILLSRIFFENIHPIKQLIGITLIAELSTLIIVMIQFNEISFSGIIMNLIFVPIFSSIIFPAVIIYNFFILFDIGYFIEGIYHLIFTWLKTVILFLGESFKHRYPIRNMHESAIILLIILTYFMAKSVVLKHYKTLISIFFAFLSILILNNYIYKDDFTITMVDVGQGDAFLIEDHKNDKVMMMDTGGKFYLHENSLKLSEKTVLPYLKERGIDQIDLMILSHMDIDHMGEAEHIFSKIQVNGLMVNTLDIEFKEWYAKIDRYFTGELIDSNQLKQFKFGDIHIENMYTYYPEYMDSSNDYSIVLRMSMNQFSFLMTGDMTGEMETEMLDKGTDVKSDVLKLAHHGSNSSSTEQFLEAVDYRMVLISAGVNNRYHHPHEEVMERLDLDQIYNTKTDGMVRFRINQETMCVETKLNDNKDTCIKKTGS